MIRTEIDSLPAELDSASRRVMQLEIEEAALTKEKDAPSLERLKNLREELREAREEQDGLRAAYEAEKGDLARVRELRERIEGVKREIEKAEREYDLNKAAELKHGVLPQLEGKLREMEGAAVTGKGGGILREEVTEDEISEIVSKWTGIPVNRLLEGEREKLLKLADILHQRVVGQDEAVDLVADAVLRARAGIKDPGRPIDLSYSSAQPGWGRRNWPRPLRRPRLTPRRILSGLICRSTWRNTRLPHGGSAPGYIGYDEEASSPRRSGENPTGPALRRDREGTPGCLQHTAADPDDGHITDSQGHVVNFKNTVIIMTSNIGAPVAQRHHHCRRQAQEDARDAVMGSFGHTSGPNF